MKLKLPRAAFGTYRQDENSLATLIDSAYSLGYRLFDCAPYYQNQAAVGHLLSRYPRESVFISTKVPGEIKRREEVRSSVLSSLKEMGLTHFDLVLLHSPCPLEELGHPRRDYSSDNIEAFNALGELKREGLISHIGVSNFSSTDLYPLLSKCPYKVEVDQVRASVSCIDQDLLEVSLGKGIALEAYGVFDGGKAVRNEAICRVAKEKGLKPSQALLSFLRFLGFTPIIGAESEEELKENLPLEVSFSAEELSLLLS